MTQRDAGAGYLADGGGPPVLVLHALWGLVPLVTEVCDRLAGGGSTAFCPDLYDGRTATTIEAAVQLSESLDHEAATVRVAAAARRLRADVPGALSVVGFSLGASFALARGEDLLGHPGSHRRGRRVRAARVGRGSGSRTAAYRCNRRVPSLSGHPALVRRG